MEKKTKEKDMTVSELAVLMKRGFSKIDKKFEVNQESMAKMVFNAVQGTQDILIEKFDQLDKKMDKRFDQVVEKINQVSLDTVDVVRKEDFDKLEDRVEVVEKSIDLKLKRA